ncbi:hypothetical protein [Brachyspira hyodysenteriae]|uniref:hypothetical protein n=1 Tax=Brachyspira hyodysenteriae TaxID=159 RepID=UPI0022CE06A6|nr:hypothetical protein [Brachyspira hyodysenteriae]MCZ9890098.1 hypothetical protein [Brachyspira hyodysenteriae]
MKNNEKKQTQDNLLKYYKEIKEEYEDTNKRINTILSYYGAYYPLNEGAEIQIYLDYLLKEILI